MRWQAWEAGERARAMNVDDSRLSQITTRWGVIFEACHGPDQADQAAQAQVLERYRGAIYRYALRVLGDSDLADEACQEFAYRFVRGDFRRADPAKGRFRDYVKKAVIHLLREFHRDRIARARITPLESETAKAGDADADRSPGGGVHGAVREESSSIAPGTRWSYNNRRQGRPTSGRCG